ncbi:MAG: serine hydrolase [Xanthobacteraceae bacterium]
MFRARVGGPCGLRWGSLALSAVFVLVTVGTDPADARGRHRRAKHAVKHTVHKRSTYEPPYAAIVVDANSGRVLHASNPDSRRHPASITKIMTLYLLFEQIEAGKLKLDTPLTVSARAASQAPSKLDLKPGQTIKVEDAIKALVTKSANDIAVVVAEAIAGSEDEFARLMTRKARALGMSSTVYANASGLPDDEQITTARDQALLGRAIQDRFPRQYRYFAISSFYYGGHAIRNHNHLLGRVAGVDGIKTGYIRMSGFNLVTSVRRGNRHLVAVVMGGTSAGSRDARMRALIDEYIGQGASERTAAKIVEAPLQAQAKPPAPPVLAQLPRSEPPTSTTEPARIEMGSTELTAHARPNANRPAPGSTEPIAAVPVKTLTVRAASTAQSAAMTALAVAASAAQGPIAAAHAAPAAPAAPAAAPAATAPAPATQYQTASAAGPLPAPAFASARQSPAAAGEPATTQIASVSPTQKAQPRSGWIIQIGAFPDENEARERLQSAQNMAKDILGQADAFTERVTKGHETLYRARFAGLDESRAEAACRHFKRNKIDCFTVKN